MNSISNTTLTSYSDSIAQKEEMGHETHNVGGGNFRKKFDNAKFTAPEQLKKENMWVVQRGQTLTGIVKQEWANANNNLAQLSDGQAHRLAIELAKKNKISNPDYIQPGQKINVSTAISGLASHSVKLNQALEVGGKSNLSPNDDHEGIILQLTLDRAVKKGYIKAEERLIVQNKINDIALKHRFKADDFAKAVLMESDGLNPAANNGKCFGVIQFCAGINNGAASVGYHKRPTEITNLSVLDQLDLVDKYFDDTGLSRYAQKNGLVNLDDLYLTILTPAARARKEYATALPISGTQALALHPSRDRQFPITRQSIVNGLNEHTYEKLRLTKNLLNTNIN